MPPSTTVVLVHGNHGAAQDYQLWKEIVTSVIPDCTVVTPRCNERLKTHDGLLTLASRLVEELKTELCTEGEEVATTKPALVLVGHSLGGLILRAALPSLVSSLSGKYSFCSLITMATPHLGSRRPGGTQTKTMVSRIAKTTWKTLVHTVVGSLYGQTGKQLLLTDKESVVGSLYSGEYMSALSCVRNVTFVAASHCDTVVPCASAAAIRDTQIQLPTLTKQQNEKTPTTTSANNNNKEEDTEQAPTAQPNTNNKEKVTETKKAPFMVVAQSGFGDEYCSCYSHVSTKDGNEHLSSLFSLCGTLQPSNNNNNNNTEEHPEKQGQYSVDTAVEVEYPEEMLEALDNLSNLRRLLVYFDEPIRLMTHDAFLHKGLPHFLLGNKTAKENYIKFMCSLINTDLEIMRREEEEANNKT
eukprot:TRINITY_DN48255_c0_g1_i1.p1 TRINITY_DN48255_c0_g1~~TRINITY_DN48255_c0_g1_i1.p1  ORF type:complete len:413 (+),score=69.46 TRINITY_DN48255_c0_g1_i1:36-1274(+)